MPLEEQLLTAWRRVKKDRKTDFIIGDFEPAIFERHHAALLSHLSLRAEQEGKEYRPSPLRTIRVPKQSFTTRPGAVPELEDRVYLQFLVDEIADAVEPNLVPVGDRVLHSYHYGGDRSAADMFRHADASHRTFEAATRRLAEDHRYVVATDVSAYFEHIYRHELDGILLGLGAPVDAVTRLSALLRLWAKGDSHGIPQGLWPTDYLGNVYLDPIDKQMIRTGYDYCRYVDDFRVGVASVPEGQRTLLSLDNALSALGLALNSAKTYILPAARVDELLLPLSRRLGEIAAQLLSEERGMGLYGDDEAPADEEGARALDDAFLALFREELQKDDPDPHACRYCLKVFRRNDAAGAAVPDVLQNLAKLVATMPAAVNYLLAIARKRRRLKPTIEKALSSFIRRRKTQTAYDWQLMWVLHALARLKPGKRALDSARRLLGQNGSLHPAVKVNAILLVGPYGDSSDRHTLVEMYEREMSPWVQRAILVAVKALPAVKRNHFYKYCRGTDLLTDKTIDSLLME